MKKTPAMQPQVCSTNEQNSLFFDFNYLLMLIQLALFTRFITFSGLNVTIFAIIVIPAYAFIFLIPAGMLTCLLNLLIKLPGLRANKFVFYFASVLRVLLFALTQLFVGIDQIIYKMYGFHFNGFVWNIIKTKGGIASLGFDTAGYLTCIGIIAALLVFETLIAIVCTKSRSFQAFASKPALRTLSNILPYSAAFLFLVQAFLFSLASFKGSSDIMIAAKAFPSYIPITCKGFLTHLGLKSPRKTVLTVHQDDYGALQYPLCPIEQEPDAPKYNIVWLVAESWRADMLTDEIMPQTSAFAKKAMTFKDHYSGGNGTRPAMFCMFYGLYGTYWQAFLDEHRPPVLMDFLRNNNYQVDLYTSARFTYPEFDKTIFSYVPKTNLHEFDKAVSWQRDRTNVSDMIKFIDGCDNNRPFMTFLFFESAHAPYTFPPECAIRKDYLANFNYASDDIEQDINGVFNRYINSCNHLDSQLGRLIDHLQQKQLLDNTIVIITGDHGEEFMEHGRWGHNSAFVEEQLRVPLVIWVPGMQPRGYEKMTSHLDIPATLMHLLGVTNKAADFSLGDDLFADKSRTFTIFSDWDSLVYMDRECKIVLPLNISASFQTFNNVTLANDMKIADSSALFQKKINRLVAVLHDSCRFTQK